MGQEGQLGRAQPLESEKKLTMGLNDTCLRENSPCKGTVNTIVSLFSIYSRPLEQHFQLNYENLPSPLELHGVLVLHIGQSLPQALALTSTSPAPGFTF